MDGKFSDTELLSYMVAHSHTPRALFSKDMAERLFKLAGEEARVDSSFVSMPHYQYSETFAKAEQNLLEATKG